MREKLLNIGKPPTDPREEMLVPATSSSAMFCTSDSNIRTTAHPLVGEVWAALSQRAQIDPNEIYSALWFDSMGPNDALFLLQSLRQAQGEAAYHGAMGHVQNYGEALAVLQHYFCSGQELI